MELKENYATINFKTIKECFEYVKSWISEGWHVTGIHITENEDYDNYTLQLEMEKMCE